MIKDIHFAADHPTAEGHFPGNPIIPGVTLLNAAMLAMDIKPHQMQGAKFLRPVRPGDTVQLAWETSPNGEIKFACTLAGLPVLTGSVT
jgi:3-hydroxymyristoyl/3-hydroxydecanoyl-(acyl carrier protein) dehydratase